MYNNIQLAINEFCGQCLESPCTSVRVCMFVRSNNMHNVIKLNILIVCCEHTERPLKTCKKPQQKEEIKIFFFFFNRISILKCAFLCVLVASILSQTIKIISSEVYVSMKSKNRKVETNSKAHHLIGQSKVNPTKVHAIQRRRKHLRTQSMYIEKRR